MLDFFLFQFEMLLNIAKRGIPCAEILFLHIEFLYIFQSLRLIVLNWYCIMTQLSAMLLLWRYKMALRYNNLYMNDILIRNFDTR